MDEPTLLFKIINIAFGVFFAYVAIRIVDAILHIFIWNKLFCKRKNCEFHKYNVSSDE